MGAKAAAIREGMAELTSGVARRGNRIRQIRIQRWRLIFNQLKFAVLRPKTPRDLLRLGPQSCPPILRGGTSGRRRRPQQRSFPKIMLFSSRLLKWHLRNCTCSRSACACQFWMQKADQKGRAAGKCSTQVACYGGLDGFHLRRDAGSRNAYHFFDAKSMARRALL